MTLSEEEKNFLLSIFTVDDHDYNDDGKQQRVVGRKLQLAWHEG